MIKNIKLEKIWDLLNTCAGVLIKSENCAYHPVESGLKPIDNTDKIPFLELEWEDDEHQIYEAAFYPEANTLVRVDGDYVTLVCSEGTELDLYILQRVCFDKLSDAD